MDLFTIWDCGGKSTILGSFYYHKWLSNKQQLNFRDPINQLYYCNKIIRLRFSDPRINRHHVQGNQVQPTNSDHKKEAFLNAIPTTWPWPEAQKTFS